MYVTSYVVNLCAIVLLCETEC